MQTRSLVVLDDDPDIGMAARLLLQRRFGPVRVLQQRAELAAQLAQQPADLLLLDMNFTPGRSDGEQGLAVLREVLVQPKPPVVLVMTAYAEVDLAVRALKAGAFDFITKPWDAPRLLATVAAALASRSPSAPAADSPLLGQSPAMCRLRELIASVAPTEANVLVLGEMGVGKELVAGEIHRQSARARSGALTAVDLGALPDSMLESELFGHRRGSFTDARQDRPGRFASAQGGTLFLDEVGNLSLAGQARLLSVLERRTYTPLGADKPLPLDVRVVSATNLEDAALHDTQRFRADLLYRLNTIVLRVPPLRERAEDIPLLAQHYLGRYAAQYGRPPRALSEGALEALRQHHWHGNVRALRHACERAVILAQGPRLEPADFQLRAGAEVSPLPATGASALTLMDRERQALDAALREAQGNISQAARQLGLSRAALYRRIEKHGL